MRDQALAVSRLVTAPDGRRGRGVAATEFLVELYVARSDASAVERSAERARLAAEELTRQGTPVRYLSSIHIPEDETCFLLYQAACVDAVRTAAGRAGLPFDHVAEVVAESNTEESRSCPSPSR
jgi:uncharacterized protein DUF4242